MVKGKAKKPAEAKPATPTDSEALRAWIRAQLRRGRVPGGRRARSAQDLIDVAVAAVAAGTEEETADRGAIKAAKLKRRQMSNHINEARKEGRRIEVDRYRDSGAPEAVTILWRALEEDHTAAIYVDDDDNIQIDLRKSPGLARFLAVTVTEETYKDKDGNKTGSKTSQQWRYDGPGNEKRQLDVATGLMKQFLGTLLKVIPVDGDAAMRLIDEQLGDRKNVTPPEEEDGDSESP